MAQYFRPESLEDALRLRSQHALTVVSGATDIYPARANRIAWGDMSRADMLDISAIPGLGEIVLRDGSWHIGARVTWTDIVRADLPPLFDGLKAAARDVGGVQIQNRGTLAGNLCTASPAGDGIPCLLALDAKVQLAGLKGTRTVPVSEFLLDYRKVDLRPDELVTGFVIPDPAGATSRFLKLGARRYLVISIAMACGVIATDEAGRITTARLAVGSCGPVARRLPGLEAKLVGQFLSDNLAACITSGDLADLAPIDDIRATADYRLLAATALLGDLLNGFRPAERKTRAAS